MMMENDDTRQSSLESLSELRKQGRTSTRIDAPGLPVDADFWTGVRIVVPPAKASVHLRMDADVLAWFRGQGKGHLTRMNAVLRSFMEAHRGS